MFVLLDGCFNKFVIYNLGNCSALTDGIHKVDLDQSMLRQIQYVSVWRAVSRSCVKRGLAEPQVLSDKVGHPIRSRREHLYSILRRPQYFNSQEHITYYYVR